MFATAGLFAQSESDAYRIETFRTSETPSVDIRTSGGFVRVHGHERDEVQVVMYVRRGNRYLSPSDTNLSDFDIDISQTGDHISAISERKGSGFNIFNRGSNISVSFEVFVPERSTVEGKTSGGSVFAENIHNNLILKTSGGSVTAKNSSGDIELNTSGGSLSLEDLQGTISAKTSGGSVNVDRVRGAAELRTSGGSISINDGEGRFTASTSGGSIRAGFLSFTDDIELKTSGGSITVTLPDVSDFDLDLSGQRVITELRNFSGSSERNSIRGRVGNGGPKIEAKTSGGRVTLRYD